MFGTACMALQTLDYKVSESMLRRRLSKDMYSFAESIACWKNHQSYCPINFSHLWRILNSDLEYCPLSSKTSLQIADQLSAKTQLMPESYVS